MLSHDEFWNTNLTKFNNLLTELHKYQNITLNINIFYRFVLIILSDHCVKHSAITVKQGTKK